MYAVTITRPGGPEALEWTEVPDPEPGPGEALVEISASAVNRADLLQRAGLYPPPPGASPYPGLECSGAVVAVGPGVEGVRPGDEVCALLAGGGYAQRVAVPAGQLLPIPAGVDVIDAAALPEVACTVWSNLADLATLEAGQTVLVHGGGSGIGTFAVQFATALGARVITTARGSKHARLRELGAAVTIDYTSEDFVAAVSEATGGAGVDVVLDIVGASYLAKNVEVLAPGGHLVIIGLQGGRRTQLDLATLLSRRASISGTSLRGRPLPEKARIVRKVREQVWPLIEAGVVRPVVDRRLPLPDAAEAHRVVAANDQFGKVLLVA